MEAGIECYTFDKLFSDLQQRAMTDYRNKQLSLNKKSSELNEHPSRQHYQSLDKIDKKNISSKLQTSLHHKKNVIKAQEQKNLTAKAAVGPEEWPPSNKRRYLKNYQLPKINSPAKLRKKDISRYEGETSENLNEDEEVMGFQKKSATLEINSPTKKRLAPLKLAITYPHVIKTKAGTTGKQTKINQDMAIVDEKMPHGIKLYCVCDGHGLNGHLVSAFIKTNLIKNLNGPLKKCHNPPEEDHFIEIIYIALQATNEQLLNCEINTELAGSTFIAVFIYQEKIFCFNIGDSRAILLQQSRTNFCKEDEKEDTKLPQLSHKQSHQEFEWTVFKLSDDQKPERPDEKERIIKSGGRVFAQTNEIGQELGPARVWMKDIMMPGLAMTRSMGDKAGMKAGTNAEPELIQHTMTANDKMIVIASDGVWEYLQNEQVMKIIVPGYMKEDLMAAAETLLKKSVQAWAKMNFARDDITFIIVKLNQPEK